MNRRKCQKVLLRAQGCRRCYGWGAHAAKGSGAWPLVRRCPACRGSGRDCIYRGSTLDRACAALSRHVARRLRRERVEVQP